MQPSVEESVNTRTRKSPQQREEEILRATVKLISQRGYNGISLRVTKGYDQKYGARPLKRAIQKYLEDELAELIIGAEAAPGDTVVIDYDKTSDKIVSSIIRNQKAIEALQEPKALIQ